MLGTILGVGAFVAILGLTATAGGQIDRRFTELAATEVNVNDLGGDSAGDTDLSFPRDAATRVESLNGVVHAGVWWPVPLSQLPVIAATQAGSVDSGGLAFTAAEPSALAAMRPTLRAGRLYDDFHSSRREQVAVLGSVAAARLGVTRLDGQAVFVNGIPYTVIGVIDDVERRPEVLFSVVIPTTTALAGYGPPTEERASMLIETNLGAARLVASQAALALRPDAPQRFSVEAPPDPQTLRGNVTNDLNALFLLLAAISLVIGAVGIANTTLVAVLERTSEIGLRRTLGARPVHIAAQFLTESTALGLLGGLVGTSLGVMLVVGMSLAREWTALLEPMTVLPAPFVGGLIGLLAGVYPAARAARIEPVDALGR